MIMTHISFLARSKCLRSFSVWLNLIRDLSVVRYRWMPLNCSKRWRNSLFFWTMRSSRESSWTMSLSRWWSGLSGGAWKIDGTSRSEWFLDWTSGAHCVCENGIDSTTTFWDFTCDLLEYREALTFFILLTFVRHFIARSWCFDWTLPLIPPLSFSTLPRLAIDWPLPLNGPCLIPVILLMPFSHATATWLNCVALLCSCCCWLLDRAGCDDTVMEWWVVDWLLTKYCPSGANDAGWSWWFLKNFGEVLGDFVAVDMTPFASPFFWWLTDEALIWFGDVGFWCCSSLIEIFSDDAIDGSCCRNWRL